MRESLQPTPILKNGRDPKTIPIDFEMGANRDVVCVVNDYLLTHYLPMLTNLPQVPGVPSSGPDGGGLMYRGDMARFLVDNLPAVVGRPATKEDYDDAKP